MKTEINVRGKGINTPWGIADWGMNYAPGIDCFATPGHGGFRLSLGRSATMPAGLRDFVGYGGPGWYEEDCDWAVVALAFPSVFDPMDVWAAIRTVQMFSDGYGQSVKMWLLSDDSEDVRKIAERFERENGKKFTRGCEGTASHTSSWGWFIDARTIDGSERTRFYFRHVPNLPSPFTREDVVAVNGLESMDPDHSVHIPDECPA